MKKAIILLGSNMGDSVSLFQEVENILNLSTGNVVRKSSLYESTPWGFDSENNFLNQSLVLETILSPLQLLNSCLRIEEDLGRVRNDKQYENRNIDIDLLFVDDLIISTDDLVIPHPRIHLRKFVLLPLVEVVPNYIHPILQKTSQELLGLCPDNGTVTKL